jgi:hypothetical protein
MRQRARKLSLSTRPNYHRQKTADSDSHPQKSGQPCRRRLWRAPQPQERARPNAIGLLLLLPLADHPTSGCARRPPSNDKSFAAQYLTCRMRGRARAVIHRAARVRSRIGSRNWNPIDMAQTKSFKELVQHHVATDPAFARRASARGDRGDGRFSPGKSGKVLGNKSDSAPHHVSSGDILQRPHGRR